MQTNSQSSYTKDVVMARGMAIGSFAIIETLMAVFISFNYFKTRNTTFETEVLGDKLFNFVLLENIFNKLLNQYPPAVRRDFPKKELGDLRIDRNIIVHSALAFDSSVISASGKPTAYLLYCGDKKEAAPLLKTFFINQIKVENALIQLFKDTHNVTPFDFGLPIQKTNFEIDTLLLSLD